MIKEATQKVIDNKNLTKREAERCMDEIMSGETSQVQTAAFLTGLATKGETIDEITACAKVMRDHAQKIDHNMNVFEIVGTGGDGSHSFNISTTAAFVLAAAGVKVAKHGNRAASSLSGTADCLEALGINIDQSPQKCVSLLKNEGICFLFAQKYHSSMKYVGPVRKELGIRTVFNLLGPLTNPSSPQTQLLGVYDESLVEPMAQVLSNLGVKRGMVVYGMDKLDEISISAATKISEIKDGVIKTYCISPEDYGMNVAPKEEIVGGTPKENAIITISILLGEKGPKRDIVLLNAGAGLYLEEKADSLKEGILLAAKLIDEGKAYDKYLDFKEASNA